MSRRGCTHGAVAGNLEVPLGDWGLVQVTVKVARCSGKDHDK